MTDSTVEAAARAVFAYEGWEDWHGAPQGWRRVRRAQAQAAVVAAFRERAEHVLNDCEDKAYSYSAESIQPCHECRGFAGMLGHWADEIEGAS